MKLHALCIRAQQGVGHKESAAPRARWRSLACRLLLALAVLPLPAAAASLPGRVRIIVLHTPGGPFYGDPQRRFVFFTPPQTLALWRRPSFGAHWIVWTDGSLWPRHPEPGGPRSVQAPAGGAVDLAWRRRLAGEARPVYSHVHDANGRSVGIEVAHSGRSTDPFPRVQIRSLAWLLRALLDMSGGRLDESAIVGHKDLDKRPAYVSAGCQRAGCPYYVDEQRQPYRWRVDPPEQLFTALADEGLRIPRAEEGDHDLLRAEAILGGSIPRVSR